jgi:hypothetical protein
MDEGLYTNSNRFRGDGMRKVFFTLMVLITLAACSNYVYDLHGKFDESFTKYNNLYRWNELGKTGAFFSDSIREDALVRIKAARNIRIVDTRILSTMYDEKTRTAVVEVEIDYYFLSSTKVKTLRDTQTWVYREKQGSGGWQLTSLLPEFK